MKGNKADIKKLEARFEELKKIAETKQLTKQEREEFADITRQILYFYAPPDKE